MTNPTTNITISAIDAKSFEDYCRRNPMALISPARVTRRDRVIKKILTWMFKDTVVSIDIEAILLDSLRNNRIRAQVKQLLCDCDNNHQSRGGR